MDYSLWSSAIFDKDVTNINSTSHEGSFHADHNGTIPNISFKCTDTTRLSFFRQWIYGVGIMPAKNYASYLGLGMRYEAGICTIVISMNGAFKKCPFCCRLNFDPKS